MSAFLVTQMVLWSIGTAVGYSAFRMWGESEHRAQQRIKFHWSVKAWGLGIVVFCALQVVWAALLLFGYV